MNSSYFLIPQTKKSHPKFKFCAEEDIQLKELVNKYGENNWAQIAQNMPNRNSRQCKERWCNYLSPSICKSPWTQEEDNLLLDKYKEVGARWVQIAKFFPQRTDISIKNRYLVLSRQIKKKLPKNKNNINQMTNNNNFANNTISSTLNININHNMNPIVNQNMNILNNTNIASNSKQNVNLQNSIILAGIGQSNFPNNIISSHNNLNGSPNHNYIHSLSAISNINKINQLNSFTNNLSNINGLIIPQNPNQIFQESSPGLQSSPNVEISTCDVKSEQNTHNNHKNSNNNNNNNKNSQDNENETTDDRANQQVKLPPIENITPNYFPPNAMMPPKKAILAIQTRTLLHYPPETSDTQTRFM
ncbi:hypothetical protein TRFO_01574 [Tritrichomonas foetus]|uniref:Myb-like DNA-binding domain containing protein n=1 Tax=Tritrichomonas foetus TaxID=1144522 RepID=A0A1J4K281_9EUKA|nr:hypothetical protein TRFO_01574 [Tritrichomonas foetus]|eukprot:OHT03852.1 hypothetical protein TRFO_01574 [Tritrichomonas foetus]